MLARISRVISIAIAITVALVFFTGSVSFESESAVAAPVESAVAAPMELAGTGPDYPIMPNGKWTQINSGEYHWYAFSYDFDEDFKPIEIRMFTEPGDGAILTIRNEEQANKWREDGTHEHFGCCTVQELGNDEETPYAVWAGKLDSSGTYYLVVEHAKYLAEPVYYRFEFASTEGVSTPKELYTPATAVVELEAASAAVHPALPAVTLKESGPDFSMAPTNDWVGIEKGEYHWYAFDYDFDEDFDPIEVRMYAAPEDAAILTVRNAEQADKWREDGTHEHLGCCTVQEFGNGEETPYAVWAGTLDSSGRYYLVVEHPGTIGERAYYRFELAASEGVSFVGATDASVAPAMQVAAEPVAETSLPGTEIKESGPDFAIAPTAEWTTIGEGEYQWYKINYDYDEDFEPFEIRIYTEPEDGAILTVRTMEQADRWREDGVHEHVGCCTIQDLGDDSETDYALWSGTLGSSGTYYLVVEHDNNVTGPVSYLITINGDGVTY